MPRLQTLKPTIQTLGSRIQTGATSWRSGEQGANARGYTYKWQKASKAFLEKHPLCECEDCQAGAKRVTAATVVDHHIPHRGDQKLFWDRNNWRAMSKTCHDSKTQRETAGGL